MRALLSRLFDLRQGEFLPAMQAFVSLFAIIAGHTTLETARDAMFLSKLPAKELNVIYVVLAGLTLVTTAGSVALARRFGRRNALVASLLVSAYFAVVFYSTPVTPRVALELYTYSGLVGAMIPPQFWMLAAQLFTLAQGRRLFGPIAAGGVLGAIAGAGGASLALRTFSLSSLTLIAAGWFVVATLVLTTVPASDPANEDSTVVPGAGATADRTRESPAGVGSRVMLVASQPLLARIAGLVVLTTAAALVVDYQFKAAAARSIAPAALGQFFARYYAAMNVVSLVVQLGIAGRLVRRLGVVGAVAVTPLALLLSGVAALAGGGAFAAVLALKAVDGALRYSLNRVATELLYLPLPPVAQRRGKGFIDSVLARAAQAVTAIVLYALAMRAHATARILALIVVALCAGWLALTLGLRRRYLDLFRRALASGRIGAESEIQELDLTSAEVLVESMASPDPAVVIASMRVLVEHHRTKLIPALVLYHDEDSVVTCALEIFAASDRTDWIPLAAKLLSHPSENVRVASVRALARKGRPDAIAAAKSDASSKVQAYAAFYLALREATGDLVHHPLIAAVMDLPEPYGRESRRALLAAVSDAPDDRAVSLIEAFARRPEFQNDEEAIDQMARAIATIKSPRLVPLAVARLARRVGRSAMREALVAVGDPAFAALQSALIDEATDPRVRLQIPQSIAEFASQRAADVLVNRLDRETNGLERYKILRALGRLVAATDVRVNRRPMEEGALQNLEEYLRLLSLRAALRDAPADEASDLLRGLIEDKLQQALARAFRRLKIAHKREDIHRVHTAALSADPRERANASEFLDVLLARRDQAPLRELLGIVVDNLSDVERVERAASRVPLVAQTHDQALTILIEDRDDTLAALAAHYAESLGSAGLHDAVARARARRPSLAAVGDHLFARPEPAGGEVAGG
jgi:AAA family ATP:ADP antiporter